MNFSASYFAGEDVALIAREAFLKHIGDNVTHRYGLHPSVLRYEQEALEFITRLLNAPTNAHATVTTGGSESLFLAMNAAREQARELKPEIYEPEILLTHTAYPVFNKAAHALGLKVRQLTSSVDYRADLDGLEAAINKNTIMMVGGAPPFPYGVVDPLEDMSELALRNNIWLHVDACIGGFVLPFAEAHGRPVPVFDFRLPACQSLSVDFHKYGYAMRGCSAVILRDSKLAQYQTFSSDTWPAGDYISENMSGSRNAGPVASAWAVINYLGYDGFLERMLKVFDSMDLLTKAIDRIPCLQVHGQPQGVHFSFGSDELDMIAIGDALMARGWMMNLQTKPESLLLMLSAQHNATVVNRYVSELTEVSAAVADGSIGRQHNEQAYGIY
ncbi:MAG: aminotransferase class V-fold PLP-dependent enzyme [Gammaproteobacteria bacterium]|nr:aminotransferase class V-fold PLP-dependent enzyme [Gammaproteobacteria bacterium]